MSPEDPRLSTPSFTMGCGGSKSARDDAHPYAVSAAGYNSAGYVPQQNNFNGTPYQPYQQGQPMQPMQQTQPIQPMQPMQPMKTEQQIRKDEKRAKGRKIASWSGAIGALAG